MTFWPEASGKMLRPLKRTCSLNPDVLPESTDPELEFDYVDIGNVSLESGVTDRVHMTFASAPSRARKLVRSDDIIVSTVRTYLKAVACIGEDAEHLVVSTGFAVLRAKPESEPRFLYSVVQSHPFVEGIVAASSGVSYPAINPSTLGDLSVPLPDLPTQKAIADFLDRETARIDQLIEKKQRMVEVLGEKRQVVISRAVTKGLDPDVPMKDSGAEWLGENPVHWDITRLKRLAAMQAGTSITSDDIESEGDYPVFGGNGVRGFTSSYTHDGEFPLIGRQGALCGCVNFATGQFWASEHAVVCTPNAKVCSRWLAQLLQAMSLNRYSQSAAQPGLSVEAIGLIAAPKLSYAEQRGIVAFLDRETANIDALVAKVGATRDRLREFRSALITAAVTGQINVSTWGKQGMTDRRLDQIEETKSA